MATGDKTHGARLMEAFIVSAATEVANKMTPVMMFCFAPEDAHLLQYKPVPDFSFPDPLQLKPSENEPKSPAKVLSHETFVFTLTDKDSTRLYGFCRRYAAPAGVEVACILTRHCWYETFSHLLDAVEETATGSTGAYGVAALIKAVTAAGLPHPGHLLHVPVAGIHPSAQTISIERPINTSRCSADRRLCVLFRSLVVSKIVMLFFLMLTERRIILMSAHPSVLSDCAHALASILYPFEWQHIYVPILVPKMIDYVCAPMPFLIGIHISMLPQLKAQPMEEVVMVDLDRGRLRYNEKDIQHLPDEHFDAMVNALQACMDAGTGNDTQDWAALSYVFMDFFLSVFSNYPRFIRTPRGSKGKGEEVRHERASSATFDNDAFVRSHRKSITKFLTEFERSQMYEVFFYQRSAPAFRESEAAADPFELAIVAIHGADLGVREGGEGAVGEEKGAGGPSRLGQPNRCQQGDGESKHHKEHSNTKEPGGSGAKDGGTRGTAAGTAAGTGGGKRAMIKGFFGAVMSEVSEMAQDMGIHTLTDLKHPTTAAAVYKPTYLRDEGGYLGSGHVLTKVYEDVGMFGHAALNGKVLSNASVQATPDTSPWREEWFGPSAARWAIQENASGKTKRGPKSAAKTALEEPTEEELERQTRYFQMLNDQRRAAKEVGGVTPKLAAQTDEKGGEGSSEGGAGARERGAGVEVRGGGVADEVCALKLPLALSMDSAAGAGESANADAYQEVGAVRSAEAASKTLKTTTEPAPNTTAPLRVPPPPPPPPPAAPPPCSSAHDSQPPLAPPYNAVSLSIKICDQGMATLSIAP